MTMKNCVKCNPDALKKEEAHGEVCETDPCEMCAAIQDGLAAVAQSLINISEGLTTIENGSRLTVGMSKLMEPKVANLFRMAPEMLEELRLVAAGFEAKGKRRTPWEEERLEFIRATIVKATQAEAL